MIGRVVMITVEKHPTFRRGVPVGMVLTLHDSLFVHGATKARDYRVLDSDEFADVERRTTKIHLTLEWLNPNAVGSA